MKNIGRGRGKGRGIGREKEKGIKGISDCGLRIERQVKVEV